jgi:DNA-directed RNA polymerase subunit RPC12/RpoP
MTTSKHDKSHYYTHAKQMNNTNPHDQEHTCPFCKSTFTGWGNNPEPVLPYADGTNVCCDHCNWKVVIKARLNPQSRAVLFNKDPA